VKNLDQTAGDYRKLFVYLNKKARITVLVVVIISSLLLWSLLWNQTMKSITQKQNINN